MIIPTIQRPRPVPGVDSPPPARAPVQSSKRCWGGATSPSGTPGPRRSPRARPRSRRCDLRRSAGGAVADGVVKHVVEGVADPEVINFGGHRRLGVEHQENPGLRGSTPEPRELGGHHRGTSPSSGERGRPGSARDRPIRPRCAWRAVPIRVLRRWGAQRSEAHRSGRGSGASMAVRICCEGGPGRPAGQANKSSHEKQVDCPGFAESTFARHPRRRRIARSGGPSIQRRAAPIVGVRNRGGKMLQHLRLSNDRTGGRASKRGKRAPGDRPARSRELPVTPPDP